MDDIMTSFTTEVTDHAHTHRDEWFPIIDLIFE